MLFTLKSFFKERDFSLFFSHGAVSSWHLQKGGFCSAFSSKGEKGFFWPVEWNEESRTELVQFHIFSVLHYRHCRKAASGESCFALCWGAGLWGAEGADVHRKLWPSIQRYSVCVREGFLLFLVHSYVYSNGCSIHYTYPRGHKPPAGVVGSSLWI